MSYTDFKERQAEELNNFPMFFAFSKAQFLEEIEKLGVKEENVKAELYKIDGGGFIRKRDGDALAELFTRHAEELAQAKEDDSFLIDAIRYELENHEYCITYDATATINVLNLDMENARTEECFKTARTKYLSYCERA